MDRKPTMTIYRIVYGYAWGSPWSRLFLNEKRAMKVAEEIRSNQENNYDFVNVVACEVDTDEE